MYFIGSLSYEPEFPIEEPWRIDIATTLDRLRRVDSGEVLRRELEVLCADRMHRDWRNRRSILLHRSAPGRTTRIGGERHGEVVWHLGEDKEALGKETTQRRRLWLAERLHSLMGGALDFVEACF